MIEIAFSLGELEKIVKKHILHRIVPGAIFLVSGPFGAGKTTMAKEIGRIIGVAHEITSPTFTYVSTYNCENNRLGIKRFAHFDLYRIGTFEELVSLDLMGYFFDQDSFCFVEWPEIVEQNLDLCDIGDRVVKIEISHDPENMNLRRLTLDF